MVCKAKGTRVYPMLAGGKIRVMLAPDGSQRFSVYDFINISAGKALNNTYGRVTYYRLPVELRMEIETLSLNLLYPGPGQRKTPSMTIQGLSRLTQILKNKVNRAFVDEMMILLERFLEGDASLCAEVDSNRIVGRADSNANFIAKVMDRVEANDAKDVGRMPSTCYVYATRSDAFPGLVKIGKADDVRARLSSLNTSCAPLPHTLVAVAPSFDSTRDEKAAHLHFALFRKEGEFFCIPEDEVHTYFTSVIASRYHMELCDGFK